MQPSARASLWILALLPACGGAVEGGSRDRDEGTAQPGPSETPSAAADDEDSGLDDAAADTELGSCVLGPEESYGQPCAWVANGRCYDTREMACNCSCPRSGNSQCSSGFAAGPKGHVWVSCQ